MAELIKCVRRPFGPTLNKKESIQLASRRDFIDNINANKFFCIVNERTCYLFITVFNYDLTFLANSFEANAKILLFL